MSKIRIILVTGLLLIVTMASSQRYFVTNQYVYDMFLMNPAAAGFNRTCVSVNGFYQRQWFGTDLAPTTQLFAVQMPAANRWAETSAFAAKQMRDLILVGNYALR